MFGDSLTVQAAMARALPGVTVAAQAGTALCDWLPALPALRAQHHPATVVFAFAGNVSPCVRADWDRAGAAGAVANYEWSLLAARRALPTERIVVVGAPAMRPGLPGWFGFLGHPALNTMYRNTAGMIGARYSGWVDDVLTPGHVFVWSRPPLLRCWLCAPEKVRTDDGVHLTAAGAALYGWALTRR